MGSDPIDTFGSAAGRECVWDGGLGDGPQLLLFVFVCNFRHFLGRIFATAAPEPTESWAPKPHAALFRGVPKPGQSQRHKRMGLCGNAGKYVGFAFRLFEWLSVCLFVRPCVSLSVCLSVAVCVSACL